MSRARELRVGVVRAVAVWWGEVSTLLWRRRLGEANCTWIVPAWTREKGKCNVETDFTAPHIRASSRASPHSQRAADVRVCTVFVPLLGPRRVRHAPRSRFCHETFPIRRLDYCHYVSPANSFHTHRCQVMKCAEAPAADAGRSRSAHRTVPCRSFEFAEFLCFPGFEGRMVSMWLGRDKQGQHGPPR